MDISSFPCTQLVFAFSLGWTLKEVNINGDFNQYIWAFSLGWTQETDVRVTSSSLLISSGKPEEVFPTNIFSVLNECPPLSTEPKLFNTIPTQFLLTRFVGPCKDMCLLYRITDINHPNFPLWLTPYKKGNDSTINLSVTFCPSKNLLIPNCFSSASLGKHIKTKDVLQRQDILWIGIRG